MGSNCWRCPNLLPIQSFCFLKWSCWNYSRTCPLCS